MTAATADLYFAYSTHKTREAAETALEESFALGDITPGERPRIETRKDHRGRVIGYAVMFPG